MLSLTFNYRKGEWLTIPKGWLCYLAPEVIRSLKAGSRQENDNLPFSRASDIYAFGYEFQFILFLLLKYERLNLI